MELGNNCGVTESKCPRAEHQACLYTSTHSSVISALLSQKDASEVVFF